LIVEVLLAEGDLLVDNGFEIQGKVGKQLLEIWGELLFVF
jgi:hypothetical protein